MASCRPGVFGGLSCLILEEKVRFEGSAYPNFLRLTPFWHNQIAQHCIQLCALAGSSTPFCSRELRTQHPAALLCLTHEPKFPTLRIIRSKFLSNAIIQPMINHVEIRGIDPRKHMVEFNCYEPILAGRGMHVRTDYPFAKPLLNNKFLTIQQENGEVRLEWRDRVR